MISIMSQSANKLLIDPKDLFSLPIAVLWKDMEGFYLGCNDLVAEIAKVSSPDEVIGNTDYDLIWHKHAEVYRSHEQLVIQSRSPKIFYERCEGYHSRRYDFLFLKAPLLAADGSTIIGTLGAGIVLNDKEIEQILEEVLHLIKILGYKMHTECLLRVTTQIANQVNATATAHGDKDIFYYGHLEFSRREAECLHYLFRNMPASQTAKLLGLSQKTIEYHIANIKLKLGCKSKADVVKKAFEMGFIELMFMPFPVPEKVEN